MLISYWIIKPESNIYFVYSNFTDMSEFELASHVYYIRSYGIRVGGRLDPVI